MSEGWAPPDPREHPLPQPPYWPAPPPPAADAASPVAGAGPYGRRAPAPPPGGPWEPYGGGPAGVPVDGRWQPVTNRPPAQFDRAPHEAPMSYPRLLRTARWRPWRPPLGLLILGLCWVLFAALLLGVATGVSAAIGSDVNLFDDADLALSSPLVFLTNNLVLAAGIVAAGIAVAAAHQERLGWLASVTGRLRWRVLLRFGGIALLTTVVSLVLSVLVPFGDSAEDPVADDFSAGQVGLLLVVVLLSTPLQAAGEEVVFRGYLTQAVSAFGRSPLWGPVAAALLTALLFALAHGTQDAWLFADRFAFGLAASYIAWRTGGLEASIALHVVNNVVLLTLVVLTGQLSASLTATELDWPYFAVDAASLLAFVLLAERSARKRRLQTRSGPPGAEAIG